MAKIQDNLKDLKALAAGTVEIDESQLEVEWKNHPKYVFEYNSLKAEAIKERDIAKENCDIIYAQVDTEIRDGVFDKKPTEAAISQAIKLNETYREANSAVIEAQFNLNKISAICDALDARGKALENLVKLWCANYFSEHTGDIEARGKVQQKKEAVVTEKIKKSNHKVK